MFEVKSLLIAKTGATQGVVCLIVSITLKNKNKIFHTFVTK